MRKAAVAAAFFAAFCMLHLNQPLVSAEPHVTSPASSNLEFTFNVDAVEVNPDPITRRKLDAIDLCRTSWALPSSHLEACYLSSALPTTHCIDSSSGSLDHGLLNAFLISFKMHKRLVLRPDDIFFPLVDAAATLVHKLGTSAQFNLRLSCSYAMFCRRRRPAHFREPRRQKSAHS